ncbi:MAG TPA: tRNA (adenosine(37)-N6)-threonylcarbamoyltransferase complex dimerization subunit type 1 TsaB [Dehalococcoidia bacterium]|nr:tRNA (adenosine(37)-N6)-threonylcarbamoyltransferase complex dimerization subunit type 1 TsaB [Dehalococcoidia bacterium]
MLLAIDTSTRYAGVALANEERVVSCRVWYSNVNHTTELMPEIAASLQDHSIDVGSLEGVAVALGPGGFSALRVGMSVAKGLALTGKTPLVGIGTLDLEAFPFIEPGRESGFSVCALLEAGRNELASAHFAPGGRRTREDIIAPLEEILESVTTPTLFCGEGVQGRIQEIQERLGDLATVVQPSAATRLWSLAALARQRLEAGLVDDLADLQPYYLRMPSIGGPKTRDMKVQSS